MAGLSATQKALADRLFAVGAVKFGQFKLKLHEQHPEAPLSPIFFNLRTPDNPKTGPLDAELVRSIAAEMAALVGYSGGWKCVAGVPRAGDPFAKVLAEIFHCSQLKMGKAETAERRQVAELIGGLYHIGDLVLLVDDLITSADSKLEAIAVLERYGLLVPEVIVLIDRQQGGRQQLMAKGIRLRTIFAVSDLVDHYVSTGAITSEQATAVRDYFVQAAAK